MEEAKKTKKNRDDKVGFGGLMIWNSRAISTAIFVLVSSFLMIYCTDTLKIPAAMVSMILVASKVLDGITDMFAGFIVDRTETRWGKARPYEIFIVGLWPHMRELWRMDWPDRSKPSSKNTGGCR